jgi:hypothetical protein
MVEKMILEMFRLRPIPMASLATRTSNSLLASLNMLACSPNEIFNSPNHWQYRDNTKEKLNIYQHMLINIAVLIMENL